MVIAGVPAAGWGDPVGLDGRVDDLPGGDHRVYIINVIYIFQVVIIGCSAALGLFLLERAIAEATLLLKEARSWWRVRGDQPTTTSTSWRRGRAESNKANKMNKVEKVNKLVAARGASNNCSGSGSAKGRRC